MFFVGRIAGRRRRGHGGESGDVSVGAVDGARSMLKLHESGEVSVDGVGGARSMLKLHGSGEVSMSEVVNGIVGGIVGCEVVEESEEGVSSLGSKVFAAQSITGLTRSRKGMPRIMA